MVDALAGLWTRDDIDFLLDIKRNHCDGDVREKAGKVLEKR